MKLSAAAGRRSNLYLVFSNLKGSYSDIILAFGVMAIVALMILPLPLIIVDILVAINILISASLVLLAIYVPSPLAFSSFPSVILLTTLFRLSLSIAITRLILLEADAGDIIYTFGNLVVGGNIVVGIVIFLIITVVQFIVIAKGAERVAEVAARFTLDAMPGKQLSIDSDLRSGLIDKDEARKKRSHLERESQLHGALDGAMKFVKGDAIAGIVILIVNILGGLAVGVLQRGMPLGEAVHTYSILTIGDGLVAQIPALLTSIAAGLIITRTAGEDADSNLGSTIGQQFSAYPRVMFIGGLLALLLTLIPGFPWPVFLLIGLLLLVGSALKHPTGLMQRLLPWLDPPLEGELETDKPEPSKLNPPAVLVLWIHPSLGSTYTERTLLKAAVDAVSTLREDYGVPVPAPDIQLKPTLPEGGYLLMAHGVQIGKGCLPFEQNKNYFFEPDRSMSPLGFDKDAAVSIDNNPNGLAHGVAHAEMVSPPMPGHWKPQNDSETLTTQQMTPVEVLHKHLSFAMLRQLPLFVGIQETSNLVNRWALDYPDLIKEMLRVVPPQRLTDVLRRLLQEVIPIRNLRDVFEAITDAGSREKDVSQLTEHVRVMLRRQISDQHTSEARDLRAVLVHPDLEEMIRQAVRVSAGQSTVALPPDNYQQLVMGLRELLAEQSSQSNASPVLLCAMDVRRHLRQLLEDEFFTVPVLSYQELMGDVQIQHMGQITA